MSKGLEKLKEIKNDVVAEYIGDYKEHFNIIEKELKALEIIKEKKVDVGVLTHVATISSNPLKDYNETIWEDEKENRLTHEEYDLLKEVLK